MGSIEAIWLSRCRTAIRKGNPQLTAGHLTPCMAVVISPKIDKVRHVHSPYHHTA